MIGFFKKKMKIMSETNPDRIFVENIRSFFSITTTMAKLLCEMAVKERFFKRKIGAECPNSDCKTIVLSVDSESDIKGPIKCPTCELDEQEKFIFDKKEINLLTYYQLVK